jgi:hypothetical protein
MLTWRGLFLYLLTHTSWSLEGHYCLSAGSEVGTCYVMFRREFHIKKSASDGKHLTLYSL